MLGTTLRLSKGRRGLSRDERGQGGRANAGEHGGREVASRNRGRHVVPASVTSQNRNLNPSRNRRSSMPSRPLLAVPVMMPKLLAFTLF